jgi:serine/threonine protein kinase
LRSSSFIPTCLQTLTFIHRFKKEAAAVAAFRHPNIVQVYDFSVDNDVYYMVLEFIPGQTLQERLKELKKIRSAACPSRRRSAS